MTQIATSGRETAANLAAYGARRADLSDPEYPIVYYAAGDQYTTSGFVHMKMDAHSEKMQILKRQRENQRDNPQARHQYAALSGLSPTMKDGPKPAAVPSHGFSHPNHRASLRALPTAKPATKSVAQLKTISVAHLAMRQQPAPAASSSRRQQSLSDRMAHWSRGTGMMPGLTATSFG